MKLNIDDESLVAAARSGEPGALRTLAVRFDERLGDEDACLDGAVMAWRAVQGRRPRSAALAKQFAYLRRHFVGASEPPSRMRVAPAEPANLGPAVNRRPAA